jgi:NAD(P)-dependent dehydrogenase (short-subunit alcohol dehydrogenase family)
MTQVWLITGSSRGLGRSLAEAVLAAGHKLVATARNPRDLNDLAERYGDQVRPVALDVTDPAAARRAIDAGVEAFGRLDVVVNNAGYGDIGSIEDMPDAAFRAQIDTNFYGVVNVSRAALPVLRQQKSGHIIQISSIGGRIGVPGLGAYNAAKWAVEGFSEVLSKEAAAFGVKVTIVEPGGFRTDWASSSMTVHESKPEYDVSVGAVVQLMSHAAIARGNPAKAAEVLIQIAQLEQPPLRLLLGSDAVQFAAAAEQARAAEDEAWRHLSLTTDFEGIPPLGDLPWEKRD